MSKKILALITSLMTLVVLCGSPAVAFAYDGSSIKKEETVYVVTDSEGNTDDVIVSDHLINQNQVKNISDETTLSDIENVKGDEEFKQSGDSLEWAADGNDIYYQGKTDQEVPVKMDISYKLDGKAISGEELQGKSGEVEVLIKYENNGRYNGETVPFIVLTGLIVTDDSFTNIKIDHGKVIDDGDKQVAVGFAAPGLAQSLDIGENQLGFGDSVKITGTAKKFAVEDMMTIVTSSVFEDVDTGKFGDLNYDDQIKQLNSGSQKLVEGSKLLYDGIDQINENKEALADAVNKLDQGANGLSQSIGQLKNAAHVNSVYLQMTSQLVGAVPQIQAQVNAIADQIDDLSEPDAVGVDEIQGIDNATDTSMISDDISKLKELKENAPDEDKEAYDKIIGDLEKISSDEDQIIDSVNNQISDANAEIQSSAQKVNSQINVLEGTKASLMEISSDAEKLGAIKGFIEDGTTVSGVQLPSWYQMGTVLESSFNSSEIDPQTYQPKDGPLVLGAKDLANGMDQLEGKTTPLVNGIGELDSGAYQVSEGMEQLYNQGIKKIVDLYNKDLKGVVNGLNSVMDAGKGYKSFTKLPSNMDGSVKFIYKTKISEQ